MRRFIFSLVAAITLAGFAGPAEVSASDNLSSSMTAFCMDASCTQALFTLNVAGEVYLTNITLQSWDAAMWKFGALAGVYLGGTTSGTDVTGSWFPPGGSVNPSQLVLEASSFPTAEPISFLVNMLPQVAGLTSADLSALSYDAAGLYDGNLGAPGLGYSTPWSAGGTVTPEPSTWLLLGTGLLGLGLVARRRREEEQEG